MSNVIGLSNILFMNDGGNLRKKELTIYGNTKQHSRNDFESIEDLLFFLLLRVPDRKHGIHLDPASSRGPL